MVKKTMDFVMPDNSTVRGYSEINGITEIHQGVEFDGVYKVNNYLEFQGMFLGEIISTKGMLPELILMKTTIL